MPAQAFALLALFILVSLLAGGLAWWLVGPRRPASAVLPILATFGALYLSGHRLGWSVGPTVTLFGFDVALPFDIALAAAVACAVAALQRAARSRVTPSEAAGRP
jgi:hypothetical protein